MLQFPLSQFVPIETCYLNNTSKQSNVFATKNNTLAKPDLFPTAQREAPGERDTQSRLYVPVTRTYLLNSTVLIGIL